MNFPFILNKKTWYLSLCFILLLLTAAGGCGIGGSSESNLSAAEDPNLSSQKFDSLYSTNNQAQWTYLIYMAADNDLEPTAWQDVSALEKAGSTDQVNIVVQWDNQGTFGRPGCRRYYITHNPETSLGEIKSPIIEELGTVDTADPDMLSDFIIWGMKNYPAEKYAVILWNHGAGWRNPAKNPHHLAKGICYDSSSGRYMTMEQMDQAFSRIHNHLGRKIDFIGMDACLMGMVEIAYTLKDYGKYLTFSEASIYGWPYDYILTDLIGSPHWGPKQLSKSTVERFKQYWLEIGEEYFTTISAIDLEMIDELIYAVNTFADYAITSLPHEKDNLLKAVYITDSIDEVFYDFRDFNLFLENVKEITSNIILKEKAVEIQKAIIELILYEAYGEQFSHQTAGISIWLPDKEKYDKYICSYYNLTFAQFTLWDELLDKLFGSLEDQRRVSKARMQKSRLSSLMELLQIQSLRLSVYLTHYSS